VKFSFIAKHRGIWPAEWLCEALGVSRGGFYAWLTRPRSERSRSDEELGMKVRTSFLASDRTYGARRVWHDLLAQGVSHGLHRIERLMRLHALKARPRRRRLPPDLGERQAAAVAPNVLEMADYGVVCSMSRSGNVWDNAAMESFFSSLKTERTARKLYRTRDEAKADVFDYVERFYNPKRRHSTIGYLSPIEFERQAGLA
jgi:putative transposase